MANLDGTWHRLARRCIGVAPLFWQIERRMRWRLRLRGQNHHPKTRGVMRVLRLLFCPEAVLKLTITVSLREANQLRG